MLTAVFSLIQFLLHTFFLFLLAIPFLLLAGFILLVRSLIDLFLKIL